MNTFFLGPWLLVCQFIEISNQMVLNVFIFQEGGSTPAPPTPPVIRVVILHKRAGVQSFLSRTVCTYTQSFVLETIYKKLKWAYIVLFLLFLKNGLDLFLKRNSLDNFATMNHLIRFNDESSI